jgi:hypothetical protein
MVLRAFSLLFSIIYRQIHCFRDLFPYGSYFLAGVTAGIDHDRNSGFNHHLLNVLILRGACPIRAAAASFDCGRPASA